MKPSEQFEELFLSHLRKLTREIQSNPIYDNAMECSKLSNFCAVAFVSMALIGRETYETALAIISTLLTGVKEIHHE